MFKSFFQWRSSDPSAPRVLPLKVPVDEETIPGYNPDTYYHPNPGDVLGGKYTLKAKIGWGSSSTVWLAERVSRGLIGWNKFYAIKIRLNDDKEADVEHELKINQHIASGNKRHCGHGSVVMIADHFQINKPNGSHHCLVFELLRDPLWMFKHRLGVDKLRPEWIPVFKLYIRELLYGLDYLHSECRVIHTDLKLDNILMTFEDEGVVKDFIQEQLDEPMARKTIGDRTVYQCYNNFGDIRSRDLINVKAKIADFGLAQRGDQRTRLIHPIQSTAFHAPEVMLGTGWSYSTDIWNFGTMLWDLLDGRDLFQGRKKDTDAYSAAHHLAEMIALLGPVPKTLIRRERDMRDWRWEPAIPNDEGKLCDNTADFFSGPFFSDEGQFLHSDLIPSDRRLRDELPECIVGDERDGFLRFVSRMLRWLPEDRATAKQLLEDPWLAVY